MASGKFETSRMRVVEPSEYSTSHSITIPPASSHLLICYGEALTTEYMVIASATSGGILGTNVLARGQGSAVSESGNVITVSYSSARRIHVIDILLFGTFCTVT